MVIDQLRRLEIYSNVTALDFPMKKLLLVFLMILFGLVIGIELQVNRQKQPQDRGTQEVAEFGPTIEGTSTDATLLTPEPISQNENLIEAPLEDTVRELLRQVNNDRALTDLQRLTGEEPICTDNGCFTIKDRATGSEGLQWAKDYVYQELISLEYSVEFQDWSYSGYADQNLIVRKLGKVFPGEELYFVAHLDGVDPKGAVGAPAADDNASGVVDLMELARALRNHP